MVLRYLSNPVQKGTGSSLHYEGGVFDIKSKEGPYQPGLPILTKQIVALKMHNRGCVGSIPMGCGALTLSEIVWEPNKPLVWFEIKGRDFLKCCASVGIKDHVGSLKRCQVPKSIQDW